MGTEMKTSKEIAKQWYLQGLKDKFHIDIQGASEIFDVVYNNHFNNFGDQVKPAEVWKEYE